jgi:Mrp family chromosome partitioning ATPase
MVIAGLTWSLPRGLTTGDIWLMACFVASVMLGASCAVVFWPVAVALVTGRSHRDMVDVVAGPLPRIIGFIPSILPGPRFATQQIALSQRVEALRIAILSLFAPGVRISLTVVSPGSSEGRSFVASTLALKFAEAGFRTVLVDGDTRRGSLELVFGVPRSPGVEDFLRRSHSLDGAVHDTPYERLSLVPRGSPQRQPPAVSTTGVMDIMLQQLSDQFDVVIIDSPRLSDGSTAYNCAALSSGMLLVLRDGVTTRTTTFARLREIERLSIRVLGSVLTCVDETREFRWSGGSGTWRRRTQ